jgi:hypothetical protein
VADAFAPDVVEPCPLRKPGPHWIEIELLGEDGSPVPWERYRITLPDGEIRSGFLDAEGKARIEHIEQPGQCQVTFPDLDAAAWDWLAKETVPA